MARMGLYWKPDGKNLLPNLVVDRGSLLKCVLKIGCKSLTGLTCAGYSDRLQDVLISNEIHNSCNKFLIPQFFVCFTCFERIQSFIIRSTA